VIKYEWERVFGYLPENSRTKNKISQTSFQLLKTETENHIKPYTYM